LLPIHGISDTISSVMFKRPASLLLSLLLCSPLAVAGESWQLSAVEWAQPRHGEWLVRQPALAAAINALQQQSGAHLLIRYPGGDEGVLWADELQAWLVALGVASSRIERLPGSGAADRIELEVSR
jgi:hypothetical protein